MILDRFMKEKLDEFINEKEYNIFPKASNRDIWGRLPEVLKEQAVREAEQYLNYQWPALKAVKYMDFTRNGNRSEYEKIYHERLKVLGKLVLGECIEHKGRFMDEIINAIWCICEQSSWSSPAHNTISKRGNEPVPDIDAPVVTLSSSETAATLTWAYYLLKEELNYISPIVIERIQKEIRKRIVMPYLEDFYWWMGLKGEKMVNNWNPWCNSNCIMVFLLVEEDLELRKKGMMKIAESLDRFIAGYSEEGGCDEGSSYWGRAGGSLFDCLELIYTFSKGKLNFYEEPIIKEIGRFIFKTHIDKNYFINFADGSAKVNVDAELIYRYGKRIEDNKLSSFGAYMYKLQDKKLEMEGLFSLYRVLCELFNFEDLSKETIEFHSLKDIWFKDIEVMAARENYSDKGLFIAAKGGYNSESHNHNDIGQFVLYSDGKPIIIDVGVETYTAKTFSPERYDIWTMQSAYHNLPLVNSYQQKEGENYKAAKVEYVANEKEAKLSLDISKAYEKEAGILSWERNLTLFREEAYVELSETFKLEKQSGDIKEIFMTCCETEFKKNSILFKSEDGYVELKYDSSIFEAAIEEIQIEDEKLRKSWGNLLRRVILTYNNTCKEDNFKFIFKKI